jgi:hypothetical protein
MPEPEVELLHVAVTGERCEGRGDECYVFDGIGVDEAEAAFASWQKRML